MTIFLFIVALMILVIVGALWLTRGQDALGQLRKTRRMIDDIARALDEVELALRAPTLTADDRAALTELHDEYATELDRLCALERGLETYLDKGRVRG